MARHTPSCPMCDAFDWRSEVREGRYTYRDREFTLADLEYSVCGNCGFDLVLPPQQRKNDARVRDAQRVIDGLLSGNEIRSIRKSLGLTQSKASEVFGGGPNAFSKYERGEVVQSRAIDQLLRLVVANPKALSELQALSRYVLVKSSKAVVRHHGQFAQLAASELAFTSVRLGSRKRFEVVNDDEYFDDAA